MRSIIVGSRELKTRLGHYLGRVRRGERILVTDRGEPVAELVPLSSSHTQAEAALRKFQATGGGTLPQEHERSGFRPVMSKGGTGSSAISSDRDERG